MSRILKFSEYIFENEGIGSYESFLMLPSNLQAFFKKNVSKNLLPKILGKNRFYIDLQGEDIYFRIDGRSVLFPFIKFVNNQVEIDNDSIGIREEHHKFIKELLLKDNSDFGLVYTNTIDNIMIKSGKEKPVYAAVHYEYYNTISLLELVGRYISQIFDFVNYYLGNNPIDEDEKELNPFTDLDLDSNPSMKTLKRMGVYLVSTPMQKKNGNIALETPSIDSKQIIIYSNGYIRRKNLRGMAAPLTTNMELTRPIRSEDDLTLKLTYVISYIIRNTLKQYGVSAKEINRVGKSIISGDSREYDDLILRVARENPSVSHILPDYNNVIPNSLKRGSAILSRFGPNFFS